MTDESSLVLKPLVKAHSLAPTLKFYSVPKVVKCAEGLKYESPRNVELSYDVEFYGRTHTVRTKRKSEYQIRIAQIVSPHGGFEQECNRKAPMERRSYDAARKEFLRGSDERNAAYHAVRDVTDAICECIATAVKMAVGQDGKVPKKVTPEGYEGNLTKGVVKRAARRAADKKVAPVPLAGKERERISGLKEEQLVAFEQYLADCSYAYTSAYAHGGWGDGIAEEISRCPVKEGVLPLEMVPKGSLPRRKGFRSPGEKGSQAYYGKMGFEMRGYYRGEKVSQDDVTEVPVMNGVVLDVVKDYEVKPRASRVRVKFPERGLITEYAPKVVREVSYFGEMVTFKGNMSWVFPYGLVRGNGQHCDLGPVKVRRRLEDAEADIHEGRERLSKYASRSGKYAVIPRGRDLSEMGVKLRPEAMKYALIEDDATSAREGVTCPGESASLSQAEAADEYKDNERAAKPA